jgi:hypothetical protein
MRRTALGLLAAAAIAAAVAAAVWPRHQARPHRRSDGTVPADVVLAVPVQVPGTGSGTDVVSYTLSARAAPPVADVLRVFRNAAEPGDALSADAGLERLAGLPDHGHPGSLPDPARSRRLVLGGDGVGLYATPTRNGRGLCLELEPGSSASCGDVLQHGLDVHVETSARGTRGRIYGVAADSVRRVVVLLRGGARLGALLGRNGFYARLPLRPAPSGLEISYRDGTSRLLRIEPFARYIAAPHR